MDKIQFSVFVAVSFFLISFFAGRYLERLPDPREEDRVLREMSADTKSERVSQAAKWLSERGFDHSVRIQCAGNQCSVTYVQLNMLHGVFLSCYDNGGCTARGGF